jgi:hypothetical protein
MKLSAGTVALFRAWRTVQSSQRLHLVGEDGARHTIDLCKPPKGQPPLPDIAFVLGRVELYPHDLILLTSCTVTEKQQCAVNGRPCRRVGRWQAVTRPAPRGTVPLA